ncbi:MAG TPA: hypothetical protein VGN14_10260 [Candidatus Elarobacter sp.]|jgi:hypothetical protein
MRVDRRAIYRMRALFGVGFIILGLLTVWRATTTDAGGNSRIIGYVLAVALIGLGAGRIVQFVRLRNRGEA